MKNSQVLLIAGLILLIPLLSGSLFGQSGNPDDGSITICVVPPPLSTPYGSAFYNYLGSELASYPIFTFSTWRGTSPSRIDSSTRLSVPVGTKYLVAFTIEGGGHDYRVFAMLFTAGSGAPITKNYRVDMTDFDDSAAMLARDLNTVAKNHRRSTTQTVVKVAQNDANRLNFDNSGRVTTGDNESDSTPSSSTPSSLSRRGMTEGGQIMAPVSGKAVGTISSLGTPASVAAADHHYFEDVRRMLNSSWRRPVIMVSGGFIQCTVAFRIRTTGMADRIFLTKKSGNHQMDNSVLAAIRGIRRYPTPPESVGSTQGVNIIADFDLSKDQ